MTELQKWITSISGAVIGQILVLGLFYLLVVNPMGPRLTLHPQPSTPQEVTVMLSRILEEARENLPEAPKPEVTEPEEKPPEPPKFEIPRQFADTEGKTAYEDAPENARFESDRNTKASTEVLPDLSQPMTEGPTQKGEDAIKHMSLTNQDYVAGEIKEPVPPPSSAGEITEPVVEEEVETPPEKLIGEDEEEKVGESDQIPVKLADHLTQPDTKNLGEESKMASSDGSFATAGSSGGPQISEQITEQDEKAIAQRKTDEQGEAAAPEEKKSLQATPVSPDSPPSSESMRESMTSKDAEMKKALTESMFDPSYLAHRRKNNQNGVITTLGEGSVDAISTAAGVYKKLVNERVGQKWHQYRQERASHATPGFLRVQFNVTPEGKVRNLKVVTKEAGELMTEFSLRAIMDAQIPPMPPQLKSELGATGLKMDYNIVIY